MLGFMSDNMKEEEKPRKQFGTLFCELNIFDSQ